MKTNRSHSVYMSLILALLLLLSTLVTGCAGDPTGIFPETLSITESESIRLEVGDSLQLTTNVSEDAAHLLTWTSSSFCVGITQEGMIIAQAPGTATVTVTCGDLSDSVLVEVVLHLSDAPEIPRPAETEPAPDSGPAAPETEGDTLSSETEPTPEDTETPTDTEAPTDTEPPEAVTLPEGETLPPLVIHEAAAAPEGYRPAADYEEALERTKAGELSGYPYVPDQAPILSDYRPVSGESYIKNREAYYADENTYVVVDAYGREVFRIFRGGAYVSLEEVAAYVYAFGDIPANYATDKKTRPTSSLWGIHLRLNHSKFSGNTSKYPYEPELPRISGCGGDLTYYEIDIGTTGTDCDPSYRAALYNNGSSITRGAARIVYARFDANGNKIIEADEKYVFYTYNHYNDFREYLNYYGGWGEMFGNITGGGAISSKYDYNPTPYVPVANAPIAARGARILSVLYTETYTAPFRMEATVLHWDLHRYRDMAA